ncbi:hypothetical protein HRI_003698900 [Hibiscus trionum]|uniref:Uncharacterized protein n=1 Tax=Hibiscus trionum TaxID=183268 RepID=A0A9W7MH41_HIBTR|nr:hypothetical protein HRI_003698900 [Hibiscus trionum]
MALSLTYPNPLIPFLAVLAGDKLVNLLSVEKSVREAIQLATALKLPILAERINGILKERLRNKTRVSNASLLNSKHDLAVSKPCTATKRSQTLEPTVPSSSAKVSSPLFTKKVKLLDRVKFRKQKIDIDQTANLKGSKQVKDIEKNGVKESKAHKFCMMGIEPAYGI